MPYSGVKPSGNKPGQRYRCYDGSTWTNVAMIQAADQTGVQTMGNLIAHRIQATGGQRHLRSLCQTNPNGLPATMGWSNICMTECFFSSGSLVRATVTDGTVYEGVFHGASTEDDLEVTLQYAKKVTGSASNASTEGTGSHPVIPILVISSEDLLDIVAKDVDLTLGEEKFKTDTEISGQGEIAERELQKWKFEGNEDEMISLEGNVKNWDQFKANEMRFGLKTDYDEAMYTTSVNRSAPGFREREQEAERIANEILATSSSNVHVRQERGEVLEGEVNEETQFSAVVREMPGKLGRKDMPNLPPNSPLRNLTTSGTANANAPEEAGLTKNIETEIADTFRQFATSEKDKLLAKKQTYHQLNDKNARVVAELKKFSQTFKLTTPCPVDLVPLLSKGKKATQADAAPSTTAESGKARPTQANAGSGSPPAPSQPSVKSSLKVPSGFKFNVNASEFKPNPSAPSFVPSSKPAVQDTSSFFAGRQLKKGASAEHLTITEAFQPPFTNGDEKDPSTIEPLWPYGKQPYRTMFEYNMPYSIQAGYPYPQYSQVHHRPMAAIPSHPQARAVPMNASPPVGYSPQMTNVSPQGSPFHGYHSPQRAPMVPQGLQPMYSYPGMYMMVPTSGPSSTTDSPPGQSPSTK